MNDCIFCKLAKNEAPSKKVYEDSDVLAFLDINPASKGHTVVITKKHFENIYDVNENELNKMLGVVKALASRMKNQLKAEGVNVLQNNGRYAGQLVSHIHFHVIPRYENDNIFIKFPRMQLSEEEMKDLQNKLKEETSHSSAPKWI